MKKFEIGDVVLVKENTTGGHPDYTKGVIVDILFDDEEGYAYDIEPISGSPFPFPLIHKESDLVLV